MTDKWLEEIEARADAATPGPWKIGVTTDRTYGPWPVFRLRDMVGPTAAEEKADAVFIAHSRADIPRLVARVRELEAQAALDAAVVENADRLARAVDIVMGNLAHTEGANWPILYDVLRSRMYTYAEARLGPEEAERYTRKVVVYRTLRNDAP